MKKEKIIFIISLIIMIFSASVSVYATSCLYNSSDVSYTAPSGSGLSANVQDSLTEVYGHCTDYTSMDTRVSSLEGHFENNATSYFDGDYLKMGNPSTSGNSGLLLYDSNGKIRTNLSYNSSDQKTYLLSNNSNGTEGEGPLHIEGSSVSINGNPVTINGVSVDTNSLNRYITITCTGGEGSNDCINNLRTTYNNLSAGTYIGYINAGHISGFLILKASNNYGTILRFSYGSSATEKAVVTSMNVYNGTWGSWVSIH